MLLNVVTSDRVTLFGLVFMMLRCLVFSTSCLATQRMNFISKGFSTQNYSGSTSFSCLASAASLVAIFWFQLEKSAGEVRRPKLQILWRNWWSKDNNSLSSSRNQLTFIYFYLPAKACTSALGMKRRARPQTFRCQANAAQHLVSLVYTLSAKSTLSVHNTGPAPQKNELLNLKPLDIWEPIFRPIWRKVSPPVRRE